MRTFILIFILVAFVGVSGICLAAEPDGDRGHHLNMTYPADAFLENVGPIMDVTKAPYNLKGSGDPADAYHNTKAFIAIYDFVHKLSKN
jgi:hypothetical protein